MRTLYSVSITSLHPQVVLARTSPLALYLKVDILDVRVAPCWGDDRPSAIVMTVQAPEQIIDRFSRRVSRQIDVIAVDVQEQEAVALDREPWPAAARSQTLASDGHR